MNWYKKAQENDELFNELFPEKPKVLDIKSSHEYPSNALSNFASHPFVFDGVQVNSMEGLLQSFKFSDPEVQKQICGLTGYAAKNAGKKQDWKTNRVLFWQGVPYQRDSSDYQGLLDRAYEAMAQNDDFKKALIASGDAVLTHSIGRDREVETILTSSEFCNRLMRIRESLK